MTFLDMLVEQLVIDEDERFEVYDDGKGFKTIGVGHNLGVTARMVAINKQESRALLTAMDIPNALIVCRSVIPLFDQLDDARKAAIANMAFNRGYGHMVSSTQIVPAINHAIATRDPADWKAARAVVEASPWCAEVHDRGKRIALTLERGTV